MAAYALTQLVARFVRSHHMRILAGFLLQTGMAPVSCCSVDA